MDGAAGVNRTLDLTLPTNYCFRSRKHTFAFVARTIP